MRRLSYSKVFIILSIIVMIITAVYVIYAISHKPSEYTVSFIGYGGTFNRKKTGVDKWLIQPYWVMHIVGIICMCLLCIARRKELNIKGWQACLTGVMLAVFGFAGAKGLYIIENYKYVKKNGIGLSGVSFFGAVFFMPAAILLIRRILFIKSADRKFMDFCIPAGVLMLACIRIGCFMNGCCRGIGIWVDDKPLVYPIQLIESTLDFLMLGLMMTRWVRKRFENRLYFLFLINYGIIRFILEFYRNTSKTDNLFMLKRERYLSSDQVRHVLSNGQIFSIIAVAAGITFMWLFRVKKNR